MMYHLQPAINVVANATSDQRPLYMVRYTDLMADLIYISTI